MRHSARHSLTATLQPPAAFLNGAITVSCIDENSCAERDSLRSCIQSDARFGIDSCRARVFAQRLFLIATSSRPGAPVNAARASQTGTTVRFLATARRGPGAARSRKITIFSDTCLKACGSGLAVQDLRPLGAARTCEVEFGVQKNRKAKPHCACPGWPTAAQAALCARASSAHGARATREEPRGSRSGHH